MMCLRLSPGRRTSIVTALLLVTLIVSAGLAATDTPIERPGPVDPARRTYIDEVQVENRVHDVGNLWLNITNYGYFGNDGERSDDFVTDPCTGEWAPQAEFPGGSGIQYLFQGGLWIGAVIREETFEYERVSHGLEGWVAQANNPYYGREFYPGLAPGNGIVERSVRTNSVNCLGDFVASPDAVSEQDFIAVYTDTSRTDPAGRALQLPKDGTHIPLGIKVTQRSYSWSYNYAKDFIIIDYEIENVADKFLKNLFVGLYVDADVGVVGDNQRHTDDICGFTRVRKILPEGREDSIEVTINTAWIADNDGRWPNVSSGNNFEAPGVTGTRVVRAPNPRLETSFNWWISNGNESLDFGPSWRDDGSDGNWTESLGTPEDDVRKYFVMSNGEFDYDQVYVDNADYIRNHSQWVGVDRFAVDPYEDAVEHEWRIPGTDDATPPDLVADLADGYDTRYLLSWGPLGIKDYFDPVSGKDVYRLNPGEKFSMTIGYVAGANFHDRNDFQESNTNIDPSKFKFESLQRNADWVAKVYDNPGIDTPDPVTGERDGWYGEDVGLDGLRYDKNRVGEPVPFTEDVYGNPISLIFPSEPDSGEGDGILEEFEDENPLRPREFDYTFNNSLFDQGDGIPDFQGPPPPPTPNLTYRVTDTNLILVWHKNPSESPNYTDPFSGAQDFEGYRVYVSNTGLENEFTFLAEFDKIDYSVFNSRDSLMFNPINTDRGDTLRWGDFAELGRLPETDYVIKKVGPNTGFSAIAVDDSTYELDLGKVSPLIPRHYAVTAFDFGDPKSGTEPLETAKTANKIYIAPSGNPAKKPMVVPNPYRADQDYTSRHMQLVYDVDTTFVSWENRDDKTPQFFPQVDRRIYFINIPKQCLIRIFTVSGDLVQVIDHNATSEGNRIATWSSDYAEVWDLNSRNQQQVVSGLYLFSVEDYTPENKGQIDVGKFVIIR